MYNRAAHGTGIVHLGIGAFHRAHQAVYTDEALAAAGGDWMTTGVSLRSAGAQKQLNPQDGLFYGARARRAHRPRPDRRQHQSSSFPRHRSLRSF